MEIREIERGPRPAVAEAARGGTWTVESRGTREWGTESHVSCLGPSAAAAAASRAFRASKSRRLCVTESRGPPAHRLCGTTGHSVMWYRRWGRDMQCSESLRRTVRQPGEQYTRSMSRC